MIVIFYLALLIFVALSAILVALVLMQEGKGGGLSGMMGASMGETFGFGGASKQIRKYTSVLAGVFMVMAVLLSFLGRSTLSGTADRFIGTDAATMPAPTAPTAPAADAPAAPVADEAPAAVAPTGDAPVAPAPTE